MRSAGVFLSTTAMSQEVENYLPNSVAPEPRVIGFNTKNIK
jgi:hypothetical protein